MNCQYCNNPVPAGAYTCPSCGAPVQQPIPQQMQQPIPQPIPQPVQQPIPQQMQQPVPPSGRQVGTLPFDVQTPQKERSAKSPGTAMLLSCLIIGAGQMYNGQVAKGLVMLIIAIIGGGLSGGIIAPIVWIMVMIDAYRIANKINSGRNVGAWEMF